jgi:aminoglycoside phosphotransferase (APT) family kinase protein
MKLPELTKRLIPFCRHHYGSNNLRVFDVVKMPGHAGFAYGFRVEAGGHTDSWFIRLPPPNVKWRGTADVLRQVAALNALDETRVPHCSVKWSGDDTKWFGSPWFVVPWIEGDVLRMGKGEWGTTLGDEKLHDLGERVMQSLARIHQVDPAKTPYLGDPVPFDQDILHWDRFMDKVAEPDGLRDVPAVRTKLLDQQPQNPETGLFHGDFQPTNFFCSPEGNLLAIIDWELCGVGATFNDLGWTTTFSDPAAWARGPAGWPPFLDPETLIDMYFRATGGPIQDINWFRALACYKFAIITGFNLALHRRGKRHDPIWENTALSMTPLINRANEFLG